MQNSNYLLQLNIFIHILILHKINVDVMNAFRFIFDGLGFFCYKMLL